MSIFEYDGIRYTDTGEYAYVGNSSCQKCNGVSDFSVKNIIIKSVINGKPVKEIQNRAFFGFTGITSISFPDSIIKIGSHAFDCAQISFTFDLPSNLEYIGVRAFAVSSYPSITIPAKVKYIGSSAFGSNANLKSINIDPNNQYYYVTSDLFIYDTLNTTLVQTPKYVSSIDLPDTLVEIGYAAVIYGTFTELVLPYSLSKIASNAFISCNKLKTIKILGNLLKVSDAAFSDSPLETIVYYGTVSVKKKIFTNQPSQIMVCNGYKGTKFATFDITLREGTCPSINILKRITCSLKRNSFNNMLFISLIISR